MSTLHEILLSDEDTTSSDSFQQFNEQYPSPRLVDQYKDLKCPCGNYIEEDRIRYAIRNNYHLPTKCSWCKLAKKVS